MSVYQDKHTGMWRPNKNPRRQVNQELFGGLFRDLLNIPDCRSIPSLDSYIGKFEEYLKSKATRERHNELKAHYMFMNQR